MGFIFNRRKKIGKNTNLNISRSGPSISRKAGPFSISSRGTMNVRLGKGKRYRKKLW